jgi:hypothetical protein
LFAGEKASVVTINKRLKQKAFKISLSQVVDVKTITASFPHLYLSFKQRHNDVRYELMSELFSKRKLIIKKQLI